MTAPLTLISDHLRATVDPGHGGEVSSLVALRSGTSLLARTPFPATAPRAGELDEDTWTAAYRGGWQLLTPNAGDACELDGAYHGFHGRASNDPWDLLDAGLDGALLRWRGHGLVVTRRYVVDGASLSATTTWEASDRPVPMLHVEHVAVGAGLLAPEVEVRLPGLRDGTAARRECWRLDRTRAEFEALEGLSEGRVDLVNHARALRLRLEWDVDSLPCLWLWQEVRGSGGIWDHRTEIVGLEPASTTEVRGLATATRAGRVTWVRPAAPVVRRLRLTVQEGLGLR